MSIKIHPKQAPMLTLMEIRMTFLNYKNQQKKRQIEPSSDSETIRRTNVYKFFIPDETQNIDLETDNKYTELKPLESLILS